jgi:hypothetical protein
MHAVDSWAPHHSMEFSSPSCAVTGAQPPSTRKLLAHPAHQSDHHHLGLPTRVYQKHSHLSLVQTALSQSMTGAARALKQVGLSVCVMQTCLRRSAGQQACSQALATCVCSSVPEPTNTRCPVTLAFDGCRLLGTMRLHSTYARMEEHSECRIGYGLDSLAGAGVADGLTAGLLLFLTCGFSMPLSHLPYSLDIPQPTNARLIAACVYPLLQSWHRHSHQLLCHASCSVNRRHLISARCCWVSHMCCPACSPSRSHNHLPPKVPPCMILPTTGVLEPLAGSMLAKCLTGAASLMGLTKEHNRPPKPGGWMIRYRDCNCAPL